MTTEKSGYTPGYSPGFKPAIKPSLAGMRLKELRKKVGITQGMMADRIGVSTATISDIERGKLNLTDRIASLLRDEFGVSLDWLQPASPTASDPNDPAKPAPARAESETQAHSFALSPTETRVLALYFSLGEYDRQRALTEFALLLAQYVAK